MVERSSTSAVTYFGSYGSRPIDRALGAAATLSIGVFLFRLLNRYVRRLQDGKKDPWITALLTLIRSRSVKEEPPSLTDTALHRGACHCRSVTFEVSSVNMFHNSLRFSRWLVALSLTVMHYSIVFLQQFRGPSTVLAKDGQGKIHYPHTHVHAPDFRFIAGEAILKIYYVLVPAAASALGVEPKTAAFTFCSRCGVHILHAPNAFSNMIDVNVDCLDAGTKWLMSKHKRNLSQGVPALDQWKRHTGTIDSDDADYDGRSGFLLSDPLTMELGNGEDARSVQGNWRLVTPKSLTVDPTMVSPGTPSTSSTSGTDGQLAVHERSFGMEDSRGVDLEHAITSPALRKLAPTSRLRLPPPLETSLSEGNETIESTTTPQMRDQLKYYMSKHVSTSGKKATNSTPKTANILLADDGNDGRI